VVVHDKNSVIKVSVGYGGWFTLIPYVDIISKTKITIQTAEFNIGNIIGKQGDNIKDTLRTIRHMVPLSTIKYINVTGE